MTKAKILIVEGRFYDDISDHLREGAVKALKDAGAAHEIVSVPGALEIAPVFRMGAEQGRFDGYIALGCVIRGETSHYDTVCEESARALTWLSLDQGLLIGNGILTCENFEQALERARPDKMDKGGFAARALMRLLDIKKKMA